jgi:hypothetical protein
MRRFMEIVILSFAALGCGAAPVGIEATTAADTYLLKTVDGAGLPAHPDRSGSRLVMSGSLTLQPDGYFVLAESDSVWNGRELVPERWSEGGTWAVDGSILTLTDTATDATDMYGQASSLYFGSIASQTVFLRLPTEDGTTIHAYWYEH